MTLEITQGLVCVFKKNLDSREVWIGRRRDAE